MKTLLLASVLLTTSLAFGTEINKEDLVREYEGHRKSFDNIKPGMTAEYHSHGIWTDSNNNKMECSHHLKEVVISTDQKNKYLVYIKSTALNNCLDEKKGEVDQYLDMRNIQSPEGVLSGQAEEINLEKISFDGKMIDLVGSIVMSDTQSSMKLEATLDITKSQFYPYTKIKMDDFQTTLLRRGYTNPDSIDLTNLEVVE
jgi:hypothetical protein